MSRLVSSRLVSKSKAWSLQRISTRLVPNNIQPCYDWDTQLVKYKAVCVGCKEDPAKPDLHKCIYKHYNMSDEDGGVLASTIRAAYLEHLDESKIDAVKEALKHCGEDKTEPIKDNKELEAIWKCADEALIPVCPKMKEMIEKWNKDPDLKGCMYED